MKTIEQDTGIYINHFIAVNFTGFENMVAALGGVYECNPTPINDPNSNLHLAAGTHLLTPAQALGYVRARYTLGDGSDLERIGRQQAFMSSLVSRVKSELLNPIAIYQFLDATTKSLTIDSQLGGITGLYNLGRVAARHPVEQDRLLHDPELPARRRGARRHGERAVDAAGRQPDLRLVPQRRAREQHAVRPGDDGTKTSVAAGLATDGQRLESPSSTPTATHVASAPRRRHPATKPTPSATAPTAKPVTIQARTANQSICAG